MFNPIARNAEIFLLAGLLLPGLGAGAKTIEVDQRAPTASDASDGTPGKPFKTINAALGLAGPGDTVLVKPGLYREAILIKRGGTPDKPLRLVSSERHGAVVSGADLLMGWSDKGGGLIAFKLKPLVNPIVMGKADGKRIPGNQLFIDKLPLVWADPGSPLTPGTWTLDSGTGEGLASLPLGSSPEGSLMEMSTRPSTLSAVNGKVDHVVVDGFHFTMAADYKGLPRSLQVSGAGWVVKNVLSDWNSLDGAFLYAPYQCRIENCSFRWNGMLGVGGNNMLDCVVKDNEFSCNNWRLCNTSDCAGGIKCIASLDNLIEGNTFDCNYGQGIWFDISCSGNLMRGNILQDTILRSVFTETDWSQSIIGNVIARTWRDKFGYSGHCAAITVAESSCCLVEGNFVLGSEDVGIRLRDDGHSRVASRGGHARLLGDYANPAFMPHLSPQRRQRVVAEQYAFVHNTETYRNAFNFFRRNIIIDCPIPYREEADYPLQPRQLGRCENYSDDNIFVTADGDVVIRYFNGKTTGLQKWRSLSGRDTNSHWLKELPALDTLPEWARGVAKEAKRPMAKVRELVMDIQDSPAAAALLRRVSLADSAEPFPVPGLKEVSALKMRLNGEDCLAFWTPAAESATVVVLKPGDAPALLEQEWGGVPKPLNRQGETARIWITCRPCYVWNAAPEAVAGTDDLSLAMERRGGSVTLRVAFAGRPGKFTGTLLLPTGVKVVDSTRVELEPDTAVSIPLRLEDGSASGLIQVRGKVDGMERYASLRLTAAPPTTQTLKLVSEQGKLDSSLRGWNEMVRSGTRLCMETTADSSDLGFAAWSASDGKSLLLCVEVKDDTLMVEPVLARLYDGDSVELFIDGRSEELQFQDAYSKGCYQIVCAPAENGVQPANLQGLARLEATSARMAGGYRIMLKLPLDAANFTGATLKGKRLLRLALQVNDRDAGPRKTLRWGGNPENCRSTSGWMPVTLDCK